MNPQKEFHHRIPGFSQIAMVYFYNGMVRHTKKVYSYWVPDDVKLKRGDHLEVLVPDHGVSEHKRVFVDQVILWDEAMTGCNFKRAVGLWPKRDVRTPFVECPAANDHGYRVKHAIERILIAHPDNQTDEYIACMRQLTTSEVRQLGEWWQARGPIYRGKRMHQEVARRFFIMDNKMSDDSKADALSFLDKYFEPNPQQHNFNRIKPKENVMNPEIKIEQITLVTAPGFNKANVDDLSDDQLITSISAANKQLNQLEDLVANGNNSTKLAAKIEKLKADIIALTEFVDGRPAQ